LENNLMNTSIRELDAYDAEEDLPGTRSEPPQSEPAIPQERRIAGVSWQRFLKVLLQALSAWTV
jgi:hypothetical protein